MHTPASLAGTEPGCHILQCEVAVMHICGCTVLAPSTSQAPYYYCLLRWHCHRCHTRLSPPHLPSLLLSSDQNMGSSECQVDQIIAMFQTSTHNDCKAYHNTNTPTCTCLRRQLQKHIKSMAKCIRVLAVLVCPFFDFPLVDGKPHHATCQVLQLNLQQHSQCSHVSKGQTYFVLLP